MQIALGGHPVQEDIALVSRTMSLLVRDTLFLSVWSKMGMIDHKSDAAFRLPPFSFFIASR